MPTSPNDDPTAAGATNVFLTQRSARSPYRREEVSIQGDENPLKALGFDSAGILRTLSAAEMIASDPEAAREALEAGGDSLVGLNEMVPLANGKVIGRKSSGTGAPEAVTVAEMIALNPAAAQAALGPVDLSEMAHLNRGRVIGRISTGAGIPEAVTVAQMIAADPAAAQAALGPVECADMAPLPQGCLLGRASAGTNIPEAVSISQMIALDPAGARDALELEDAPAEVTQAELDAEVAARTAADTALSGRVTALEVSESAFVMVDNEAQYDAALVNGRSMVLRGEGTGGVIAMTTPKVITYRFTEIKSDAGAHLQFTLLPSIPFGSPGGGDHEGGFATDPHSPQNTPAQSPRAITVLADDVTLRNFELSNNHEITANTAYGIVLSEAVGAPGHRLKLLDMHIHNWGRCVNKDAEYLTTGKTSPIHEDILIERCNIHTFNWSGIVLNFGMRRLMIRDTRVLGRISTDPGDPLNTHHNCIAGGSNWFDCVIENCHLANCGRIVIEILISTYNGYANQRTRMSNCLVENCRGMGISFGFATEAIIEKCRVKNIHYIGIELAGRNPEHEGLGNPYRYATGIIESCEIDGLTGWSMDMYNGSGQAIAISLDGCLGAIVRGATKISNVQSVIIPGNGSCGVGVVSSHRCSVRGATFDNIERACLYATCGNSPNTQGFHEFVGNTFRNTDFGTTYAVQVANTTVDVRENVFWQKAGTPTPLYIATNIDPARAYVDGTPVDYALPGPPPDYGYIAVPFTGSNRVLPASNEDLSNP